MKPLGAGPSMEEYLHRFGHFVWEVRDENGPIRDDRELLRLARLAREHITLGNRSQGYCTAICIPLATYLTKRGMEAQEVNGGVGDWQHMWIALGDGRILDPTADQFNRAGTVRMPAIYLGPRPAHYECPQ